MSENFVNLLEKADTGDISALYDLTHKYLNDSAFCDDSDPIINKCKEEAKKSGAANLFLSWCCNPEHSILEGGLPQSNKYLTKAAELGLPYAQYELGFRFENAYKEAGLEGRDFIEAVKWYHASAEQGYPKAKKSLSYLVKTLTKLVSSEQIRGDRLAQEFLDQQKNLEKFKATLDAVRAITNPPAQATSHSNEPVVEANGYRILPRENHSLGREITALGESSRLQGIHNHSRNQFAKEPFL